MNKRRHNVKNLVDIVVPFYIFSPLCLPAIKRSHRIHLNAYVFLVLLITYHYAPQKHKAQINLTQNPELHGSISNFIGRDCLELYTPFLLSVFRRFIFLSFTYRFRKERLYLLFFYFLFFVMSTQLLHTLFNFF